MAAIVAHLLRGSGDPDPLASPDPEDRLAFVRWVTGRTRELGYASRRKVWVDARNRYFSDGGGPWPLIAFAGRILRSRRVLGLLTDKLYGTSLPHRMAREWRANYGERTGGERTK